MRDIVITFDKNINTENRLRLMLRAIENSCSGYNEIYIVGDKPDWIQGVVHIDFSEVESKKFLMKNNFKKLRAATLRRDLTDDFVWIDANDVIPMCDFSNDIRVNISETNPFYRKPIGTDKIIHKHTFDMMHRRGFTKNNYFNSFPMSINREKLNNTFDEIDFDTAYGYCIKTLYSNFNRLIPTNGYEMPVDLSSYIQSSTYEKNI